MHYKGYGSPPGKLLDMWPNSLLPPLLSLDIIRTPDDITGTRSHA